MGAINILLILSVLWASQAKGQSGGLLPQGVGLYQLGYRSISEVDTKFDENGSPVPLGENFDRSFTGPQMLEGTQGKDLQKLSGILREFEAGADGPGTLTGDLRLGQLRADVRAQIDTTILGLGFGLSKNWTGFVGMPYVTAQVDTKLQLSGENNAQATLDKIGSAAFPDLRDGLVRASQLNTQRIKSNLQDLGYKSIERWSYAGFGDLRVGAKTAWQSRLGKGDSFQLGLLGRLDVPTGYVERPDILTDVSFGKGYYSLGLGSEQIFQLGAFHFGTDQLYAYNFDSKLEKKLPEGKETTMPAERTIRAEVNPGDDMEAGIFLGGKWGWTLSRYRFAFARHLADTYNGSLPGNYGALSEESDVRKLFHELSLSFDTAKAYRAGQFLLPLILSAKAQLPIEGRNTSKQTFYEISLASFFSTPMADRSKKLAQK